MKNKLTLCIVLVTISIACASNGSSTKNRYHTRSQKPSKVDSAAIYKAKAQYCFELIEQKYEQEN